MSELFREIEEDIRAERIGRLWQKFGKTMVWVSVAIVAGTAAGVLWKDYRESKSAQQTSLLISGMQQLDMGDAKKAGATFDALAEHKTSAHYAIAMLHKADAQMQAGDAAGAKETLQALAALGGNEDTKPFAELAALKLSENTLSAGADSPFRLSLMEHEAWALLAEGKAGEAAAIFTTLTKELDVPASMRNRATLALQTIATKEGHE